MKKRKRDIGLQHFEFIKTLYMAGVSITRIESELKRRKDVSVSFKIIRTLLHEHGITIRNAREQLRLKPGETNR